MKTSTLIIRQDEDLDHLLAKAAKQSGKNRSEIAREALQRQLCVGQFNGLRKKIVPFAEAREKLGVNDLQIEGAGDAYLLAEEAAGSIPGLRLRPRDEARRFRWSAIVEHKQEIWPIQFLLPGGADITMQR